MILTLDQARRITEETLRAGREAGMQPLCVAVFDDRGLLRAALAEDGCSPGRFDIASAKARGVLALGMGGRSLRRMAAQTPVFATGLSAVLDGGFVAHVGGVLIRAADGATIGAAGVSGDTGERDEAAVVAGITQAGLHADAGKE